MNTNTIISQRLKLVQQDLFNADWGTVFSRVISQGRQMTAEQIEAERLEVMSLYCRSRTLIQDLQNNSNTYFREKIQAMNMPKVELGA